MQLIVLVLVVLSDVEQNVEQAEDVQATLVSTVVPEIVVVS